jgi:hypothetical protein
MGMRAIFWSEVARDCMCSTSHFLLTPNRARHPLGVLLRTFDQRRFFCPRRLRLLPATRRNNRRRQSIQKYSSSLPRSVKKLARHGTTTMPPPLAATYTEAAVLVHDTGPVYGREAIESIMQTCSSRSISATILASGISIPRTLWERLAMRFGATANGV